MPRRPSTRAPIREIRFSRLRARQCRAAGPRGELAACDAIVNGPRRPAGGRGAAGGPLVIFGGAGLRVVGELLPGCCVALRLARSSRKISAAGGFLIRAPSK
jgi:hypothetical protein